MITHNLTLDLAQNNTNTLPIIYIKQNDRELRTVRARLTDKGLEYIPPSGAKAVFRYAKPDGTAGFYDADENNNIAVSISGSIVSALLVEQVGTCAGEVHCEINIYTPDARKITSFTFKIHVQASVIADTNIVSSDYYNALTAVAASALEAAQSAENAAQRAVDAANSVNPESFMNKSVYDPQGEGRDIFKALNELIPAGVTWPYAGATAPSGFLLCQGQAVSRTTYARLFAAIGTLHGAGDGSTTFNVPDMRDRFPYGAGKNALGKIGGEEAHTLTKAELPAVIPEARQYASSGTGTSASYIKFEYGATWTTSSNGFFPLGEGQPHNTIPPFVALNYIIKI